MAALFAGAAVLLKFGEGAAIAVVVVLVGVAIGGFFVDRAVVRGLLMGVVVVLLASVAFLGFGVAQLVNALTTTEGPVDPPDPVALASAEEKVDDVRDAVAFRFELTESEMTAYVLDGLQGIDDNPLQSVVLDVVDGIDGGPGHLDFDAEFKSGGVGATGSVTVVLERGAVRVDLADVSVGSFDMPGLAQTSLEDLVERLADFNETLASADADVQSITLGNDRLTITGTQTSTNLLTSTAVLDGLQPGRLVGPGRRGTAAGATGSGRGELDVGRRKPGLCRAWRLAGRQRWRRRCPRRVRLPLPQPARAARRRRLRAPELRDLRRDHRDAHSGWSARRGRRLHGETTTSPT